uniref:Putative secreted protein n=1 Tax=Anopheles darlingi TaxID=43151 RepID=A0A2M4D6D7_ANODA
MLPRVSSHPFSLSLSLSLSLEGSAPGARLSNRDNSLIVDYTTPSSPIRAHTHKHTYTCTLPKGDCSDFEFISGGTTPGGGREDGPTLNPSLEHTHTLLRKRARTHFASDVRSICDLPVRHHFTGLDKSYSLSLSLSSLDAEEATAGDCSSSKIGKSGSPV